MIKGIQITATFVPPVPFTDEWLEAVYTSVQGNMAIISADMFIDEEASAVTFHLGVDASLCVDPDEFVAEVAREALTTAFDNASGADSEEPTVTASEILVFA